MSVLLQDLRFALHLLIKRPGFTAIIVVTLALGVGANTAIFSVVDAILLRPLPCDDPDRLTMIWETAPELGHEQMGVAYANFEDWREQNQVFEGVAAFRGQGCILTGVDNPERIQGALVTSDFFPLLRIQAALGRTFVSEDEQRGPQEVVVLSDGLWRRRFGADPEVIGRPLTLDGVVYTVIGVLPSGFDFPVGVSDAEVWRPAVLMKPPVFLTSRSAHAFNTIARLKPRVTHEQAQTAMETIASRLQQQYPDTNAEYSVKLVGLHEQVVGKVRPVLLLLSGAVALVLLIACTNISSMLLARSEDRKREFAVRTALGAGRSRHVRQLLTEAALLGVVGGALALLMALWSVDALAALIPADLPLGDGISVNGRVATFALGLSLVSCLIFSLVPALRAGPSDLPMALKEGGQGRSIGAGHSRLRGGLVISQVALALVLLIGAGLLIRSLGRLLSEDLGFDADNVLTFELSLPDAMDLDVDEQAELYRQVLERLEALPSVRSASINSSLPLTGRIRLRFRILGRPESDSSEDWVALYGSISPDYFGAMGIPLLKGRAFTDRDVRGQPGVAIVNSAMAQRFWPGENPLGQHMRIRGFGGGDQPESFEIVGIVGDMYVPVGQQTWGFASFAVRTENDPTALIGAVRREVATLVAEAAPHSFKTFDQCLASAVAQRRFAMIVLGLYATAALFLASTGIYGVVSHSVSQRTQEIGVRMVVGALRGDVLRLVIKQGLTLVVVGIGIGLLGSLASTHVLLSQLHEISATDPVTFIGVSLLLAAVALLACYIPARRATKIDPIVALRCE
jgi:putative ABC transport system permease protein